MAAESDNESKGENEPRGERKAEDAGVDLERLKARVGSSIKGKWTLKRLIGAGGMAAVYEATHEIGRRDAIKILHPDFAQSKEAVERFKREAHAANRFEHPGAVEIRDVDVTDEGEPFLVMELLEGESLARRLKREGRLPLDEVLRMGEEILAVLEAAHAEGVIHRDIKPSNLFLEKDGRLRVLDFGVARLTHAPGTLVTEVGTTLGTVAYMPPEQLEGREIDPRADLYAVGATLFRLLAGQYPHAGASEDELARKVLAEQARPLASVAAELPADVGRVVDRALALAVEGRYPDATTMLKDVRALRAGKEPPFASSPYNPAADTLVEGSQPPPGDDAPEEQAQEPEPDAAVDIERGADGTVVMKEERRAGDEPAPGDAEDDTSSERPPSSEPHREEDATTLPRAAVAPKQAAEDEADEDEEARAPGKTEMAAAGASPTLVEDEGDADVHEATVPRPVDRSAATAAKLEEPQRSDGTWLWVLAIAAAVVVVYLVVRPGGSESVDDVSPIPRPSGAPPAESAPPAEPEAAAGGEGAEPAASTGAGPGSPGGLELPTALPSALASALPSGFPTALPTSFPTAIPTSWPTAFPSSLPTLPWPTSSAKKPPSEAPKTPPKSAPKPPEDPYE